MSISVLHNRFVPCLFSWVGMRKMLSPKSINLVLKKKHQVETLQFQPGHIWTSCYQKPAQSSIFFMAVFLVSAKTEVCYDYLQKFFLYWKIFKKERNINQRQNNHWQAMHYILYFTSTNVSDGISFWIVIFFFWIMSVWDEYKQR